MLAVAMLVAAATGFAAWHDTMATPIVRRTMVVLPGMAAGTKPITIALLSDTHPAQTDMPLARLARIIEQVNALHADVIVLAGDYVSDGDLALRPYPVAASIQPLAKLHAQLGVFAVIGNHDHWNDSEVVRRELAQRGITVLINSAQQVGPLAIGGLDDAFTGNARLPDTLEAMSGLHGGRILVSHSPDPFAKLPANTGLMLAGHTHCGQVRLFGWAPITNSRYGQRYLCGLVRERGNTLVVTAGLGASVVPVRLGAPPDIWLIEVRPQAETKKAAEP